MYPMISDRRFIWISLNHEGVLAYVSLEGFVSLLFKLLEDVYILLLFEHLPIFKARNKSSYLFTLTSAASPTPTVKESLR